MKKIIPLIRLTADFANVIRTVGYRSGHLENDAEHSFQLAMVCWSANHQYNLKLNDEKILKFALVHDLVEVYAGDTDAHGDKKAIEQKKSKEQNALKKLIKDYPMYSELFEMISEYNKKQQPEAQLVNLLDKFIPDVHVYYSKSDYYQVRKVSLTKCKEWLHSKIDYQSLNPKLKNLFDESLKELETTYKNTFFKV